MNRPRPCPPNRPTRPTRRSALQALAALPWLAAVGDARAAPGGLPAAAHGDASPEWDRLREQLFGGRPLHADGSVVQLIAPLRAAYGASVPVKIVSRVGQSAANPVRRLTLVVDKNPSPLALSLALTPAVGQADFEVRLRVDEYSHVRVVSELADGTLHTDSRYVKTSGGCSAPPNREALHLIGRTVFKLLAPVRFGETNSAEVTVVHPNDTGFELNQASLMYIPAHFVRTLNVSYAGATVFEADMDFSVSENPTLRFNFVPPGPGELRAEVVDSRDAHYAGVLQLG